LFWLINGIIVNLTPPLQLDVGKKTVVQIGCVDRVGVDPCPSGRALWQAKRTACIFVTWEAQPGEKVYFRTDLGQPLLLLERLCERSAQAMNIRSFFAGLSGSPPAPPPPPLPPVIRARGHPPVPEWITRSAYSAMLAPPFILTQPFPISAAAAGFMRGVIRRRMWDPARTVALISLLDGGNKWVHRYVDRQQLDPATHMIHDCIGVNVAVAAAQWESFQGRTLYYHLHGKSNLVLRYNSLGPSLASHPGLVPLSQARFLRFCPFLVDPPKEEQPWCALVIREAAGHLWQGCIGSAVVAVLRPLIVAAYACDLDGVVLLQFPDSLVEEYNLEAGSRLLCVNIFSRTPPAVPIEHGPASSGSWADFHPLIAEFFSDDRQRVLERKAEVDEPMWQRASECAAAAVRRRMPVRDGRYSTPLLQPPYFSPTP
jgi:hypothetical protein